VRAEGAPQAGILALRRALVISKREIDERHRSMYRSIHRASAVPFTY